MSELDLDTRPHHIRGEKDVWWYEEPKGLCLIVRFPNETKQLWIPWKSIKNALARRER